MAEQHKPYYDRIRSYRQTIVNACRSFVSTSAVVKAVLLWERKRTESPAEIVHHPYRITLVTEAEEMEAGDLRGAFEKL